MFYVGILIYCIHIYVLIMHLFNYYLFIVILTNTGLFFKNIY